MGMGGGKVCGQSIGSVKVRWGSKKTTQCFSPTEVDYGWLAPEPRRSAGGIGDCKCCVEDVGVKHWAKVQNDCHLGQRVTETSAGLKRKREARFEIN